MRIQSSQVALTGAHAYSEERSREESFRFWVGSRRPTNEVGDGRHPPGPPPPPPPPPRPDPRGGASPNPGTPTQCPATSRAGVATLEAEAEARLDPLDRMIKALVERLFGVKIRLVPIPGDDAAAAGPDAAVPAEDPAAAAPPQGWGLDYQLRETRTESESTDFSARGVVRTTDGRELKFNLSLSMRREYTEEYQFRLQAGDALIDPLVINLDGGATRLTDRRYAFDLNADGQAENIPFVQAGSALLALDQNEDGRITDGRELFGPTTGNGFDELARYDVDHNAWIDENDPVYRRLRLLGLDGAGNPQLSSLEEQQVGALYLGNTRTPFTVKSAAQETLGEIATTGVYLSSQGTAGTVQQVNLVA